MTMTGGCQCGALRYRAEGEPLIQGFCHCRNCQRISGGGHVGFICFPEGAVTIEGATRSYGLTGGSGRTATRYSCPTCHSGVFGRADVMPGQINLYAGSLDDTAGEIILKQHHHLGLATNTDEGLTVPIIHDADRLGLFALAREIDRLATAAREHKLKLEELQGGTFTVTSTGAKGGVLATPILHHPQVAILGIHAVTKKPAVVNGQIVIRDLGNLSLSLDHRVVDGAVGADFLYALVEKLQTPDAWLGAEDLK